MSFISLISRWMSPMQCNQTYLLRHTRPERKKKSRCFRFQFSMARIIAICILSPDKLRVAHETLLCPMQNGNFMNEIDLSPCLCVCRVWVYIDSDLPCSCFGFVPFFSVLFYSCSFLSHCSKAAFYVSEWEKRISRVAGDQQIPNEQEHAYSQINNTRGQSAFCPENCTWNLKLIDCDSSSVAFVIWQLINRRVSMTCKCREKPNRQ